jgi:ELWxxDGT repeat protein
MAKIIFSADDGTHGTELWVADGTAGGTSLLKDINNVGDASSNPGGLTALGNGKVLFQAKDSSSGSELWVTDGTTGGTVLLKDINPSHSGTVSSGPTGITLLRKGVALFTADNGVNGRELWVTDGTAGNTTLLKDINVGAVGSAPAGIVALGNGSALFQADNGVTGADLWVTAGTALGTSLVMDIDAGAAGSNPFGFTSLGNGTAIFQANDGLHGSELWVTDGTAAHTSLLMDIDPIDSGPPLNIPEGSNPSNFVALGNGKAVFEAVDATHGNELWVTDGTAGNTFLVRDIIPGAAGSTIRNMTSLGNGTAVFQVDDGTHGTELWVTDGTAAGTSLLQDINPGLAGSNPSLLASVGSGKVLFAASNGTTGFELWVTDGTAANTFMVKDINQGSASSTPFGFTAVGGGEVLFEADNGTNGTELWMTDGTAAGTALLTDINPLSSSFPGNFTVDLTGTVDITPPAAPSTPDLVTTSDTGASDSDNVTNVSAALLAGTAEADATVTLFDGAAVVGTAFANKLGVWSATTAVLADGVHAITATATDLAGNTGPASAALSVTIDTTAPDAPAVAAVTTGSVAGTAEENSAITVFDGATEIGAGSADSAGNWSISIPLPAGIHPLSVTATDLAGNLSTPSAVIAATIGTAGNDVLLSTPGIDAMFGGQGSDTYFINNSGDTATESGGEGTDTVWTSVDYALAAGSEIEFLRANSAAGLSLTGNEFSHVIVGGAGDDTIIGGIGNDTLNGNAGADMLTGGAGNDTLNGGAGADTMIGGTGNDAYNVDNAGDVVTEAFGGGTDTVFATVSYTLAAGSEVETMRVNVATGLTLTGNEFNNIIIGNAGNDTLIGGAGNDTLNGNAGADTMIGGTGNDAYNVDNAGDVVTEALGEGIDTVFATVSYTLAAGSEVETMRSNVATGLILTGNELNNIIIGNTGNDTLNGGAGNDTLNGNAGSDTMVGGTGNDTYTVDNAADVVTEAAGEGTDTINASVSYTLAAGSEVERLAATVTTAVTFTGNEFANNLVGNNGDDTLSGGLGNDILQGFGGNDTLLGGSGDDQLNGNTGADTMTGGIGNDTYFVDNAGDVVNEAVGEATDTVLASVNYALTAGSEIEFLRANAGATGLSLTGNALANRLVGGAGNDTLEGGAGNDSLGGGAGNDIFKFLAGFGQDTITDFTAGPVGNQDLMDISGLGVSTANFDASVTVANGGGGSTLVTIGGNSIRLLAVGPTNITQSDFILA